MDKPYQRIGSVSNAHVGADFEKVALQFFRAQGIELQRNFSIRIGVAGKEPKKHYFDLGSDDPKIIIECKSHKWTAGAKIPSAKMAAWNEAMYYFHLTSNEYKKVFFTLHDKRTTTGETLVGYYKRIYTHLIPKDVEFLEFNESTGEIVREGHIKPLPRTDSQVETISKRVGIIELTQGNFNQKHIYLAKIIDIFPSSSIGGGNKSKTANTLLEVHTGVTNPVITDIAGDKKIFRRRDWEKEFFKAHSLRVGDKIVIDQTGPNRYHVYPKRGS